jgi:hypothetical protein
MKTVVVQARAAFSYQGRGLRAGELVTMLPVDAAAAARHGLVSLTRRPTAAPVAAPKKSKRRYQRRDLEAEST